MVMVRVIVIVIVTVVVIGYSVAACDHDIIVIGLQCCSLRS